MAAEQHSCMELALEGERLCKDGDCRSGVSYFEAAIQKGTEDLKTLSAIYSQLGNAYFYLQEYEKALEFHKHDLTLARTLGDRIGEAKASGNLGNTLKVLGKFDEAIVCCTRHLDISRELSDKVGEARALYNLGNVYHAKGKHLGRSRHRDPGDFPEEVRFALERAVEFYEANLVLVRELRDRAAEGRAYGNLGNTHYLLGNFDKAVQFHEENDLQFNLKSPFFCPCYVMFSLKCLGRAETRQAPCLNCVGSDCRIVGLVDLAPVTSQVCAVSTRDSRNSKEPHPMMPPFAHRRQFNDSAAERRAFSNLGNAHVFLGEFEIAAEYYKKTLEIAERLGDRAITAQACYSLGNTYTLLKCFEKAVDYHQRHLTIAKELGDRVGEGRAYWSLGNAYTALNKHELALQYAEKHLSVSKEVQDRTGELTAEMNIADLKIVLGISMKNTRVDVQVSGRSPDVLRPGNREQNFVVNGSTGPRPIGNAGSNRSLGDVNLSVNSDHVCMNASASNPIESISFGLI
eukprot:gene15670-17250_t